MKSTNQCFFVVYCFCRTGSLSFVMFWVKFIIHQKVLYDIFLWKSCKTFSFHILNFWNDVAIDNIFIIQEWGSNRRHNPQYKMIFFFSGCFCDILIRGRIRPERKYYVTKIICFFQERNRFVNCSDPGASFYVLGQTG